MLDEHAPEAGTVNEEVALEAGAVFQRDTLNEAIRCACDPCNLSLGSLQSALFGIASQEARHEGGIDVVGVIRASDRSMSQLRRRKEAAVLGHDTGGQR